MATLRYSPRNFLIVDWPFDTCSLPSPLPCKEAEERTSVCKALPIREPIDTYDWARFLPEVMVGIEEPDQDIAANYVRQAAIEFARDAHVLQRDLVIDLEPGENEYFLEPYEQERLEGILRIEVDGREDCTCYKTLSGVTNLGFFWEFDTARNVLRLEGQPRHGRLKIRVWAVPTEDACSYDKFLYDNFRADITVGARRYYVLANHFRDRLLVTTLPTQDRWTYGILTALKRAHRIPSARLAPSGSGMWSGTGRAHYRGSSRERG